jgi:hypothetical protein
MTRKDYQMMASVIRPQVDNARTIRIVEGAGLAGNIVSDAMANVVQTIAYNLAQHLFAENSRFDHMRFYEACGFRVEDNFPLVFSDERV